MRQYDTSTARHGRICSAYHYYSTPRNLERRQSLSATPGVVSIGQASCRIPRNGNPYPTFILSFHSLVFQNSGELGLESVGEISQSDGALQFTVTSQYGSRNPRTSKPHWRFCGVDLLFSWSNAEDDPFAEHCPLPYMSLLDDVLHRFATFQLARLARNSVLNAC